MRIAMVAEPYVAVLPIKYGGTERVMDALIQGLQEKGHEVVLLAAGDSQVDCELIPICAEHLTFGKDPVENTKIRKRVNAIHAKTRRLLRAIAPRVDLIHSHGFDLIQFQRVPNLTTLHGSFIFSQLRYFEKRTGLFYVSISENQQAGFPDLQYVGVCYNGLNPEEFPVVTEPDDYLCFIGRFDEEKSPHLAIELALRLERKIKVAGKVDYLGSEYFRTVIEPYFRHPLVEYMGEVDMQQKIELMSHAAINLHPTSFREPFGLTVLEAAYCGTPSLAISKGSMPELIEDGRTGLLVEDFVEGYHHIDQLLAMDRQYIADRSRSLFNYTTMTRQYELAYQKVIEIFSERRKLSEKTLAEMQSMREVLRTVWRP